MNTKSGKPSDVGMIPTEHDPELLRHAKTSNKHWPKTKIVKVTQSLEQLEQATNSQLDKSPNSSGSK